MKLKERRAAILKDAQAILDSAKSAGRDISPAETAKVEAIFAEIDEIDGKLDHVAKGDSIMKKIAGLGAVPGGAGESGVLSLAGPGSKALAGSLMGAMREHNAGGFKALVESGSSAVASSLDTAVIREGVVPASIVQLLPAVTRGAPTWRYLRQTTRTNNAAIVAAGATKPTSVYTVTEVTNELQVFAHISEAVGKYMLIDNGNLQRFLAAELQYGLGEALEKEVLTGDGTSGHLTGILETSGVQSVSYSTDKITTLRAAVTALETAGFTPGAFVLAPDDWEDIETARNESGQFDLDGPIDRAKRQAWGVPVVTSNSMTAGTALALDLSTLTISTDGNISLQWSDAVSDDFSKNQIRARCEGRFALDVYQPNGIAKVTLTST